MAYTPTMYRGGCLCGGLRYEARGEPQYQGFCYCADCRKATGTGAMPFMGFPRSAVTFTGVSKSFSSTSARGGDAVRNFCPACGGLVFGGERDKDETHTIYAGSLDDVSLFRPKIAIFTRDRPAWAGIPDGLKTFDRGPE